MLASASPPKVIPLAALVEPAPPTDKRVVGEAVPIPTLPFPNNVITVAAVDCACDFTRKSACPKPG
jgi:hypothetical protein